MCFQFATATVRGFKKLIHRTPEEEDRISRQTLQNDQRQNHRGRLNRGQNANTQTSHKLKTLYTNIDNSLLSKLDELLARIEIHKPDIIPLTEIKPKNGQTPNKDQLQAMTYSSVQPINMTPLEVSASTANLN